jgi:hypothetical protein
MFLPSIFLPNHTAAAPPTRSLAGGCCAPPSAPARKGSGSASLRAFPLRPPLQAPRNCPPVLDFPDRAELRPRGSPGRRRGRRARPRGGGPTGSRERRVTQPPPRSTWPPASTLYSSEHHSQTFPCISNRPSRLGRNCPVLIVPSDEIRASVPPKPPLRAAETERCNGPGSASVLPFPFARQTRANAESLQPPRVVDRIIPQHVHGWVLGSDSPTHRRRRRSWRPGSGYIGRW